MYVIITFETFTVMLTKETDFTAPYTATDE